MDKRKPWPAPYCCYYSALLLLFFGGPPGETQVSGVHGQSERGAAEGGRSVHRQAEGPDSGTDPPHARPSLGGDRGRAKGEPAWLESVL